MDELAAREIAKGLPQKHHFRAHASIDCLTGGRQKRFKPDDYGRIHTNVTNLKRELRPTLHFGNSEPLVELDISCSQPTLVHALMPLQAQDADDSQEYLKLCRSGDLYTVLAGDMYSALVGDMKRNAEKQAFFHFLYSWPVTTEGRQRRAHNDPIKEEKRLQRDAIGKALAAQFPTVSNHIQSTKQQEGHKGFSHKMQRLESQLIIDGVCGRLMRDDPSISVLTIHDSLLMEESNVERVQEAFEQSLQEKGITASIRLKSLTS